MPGVHEHGSNRKYRQGCRCDECRAAHAEYARTRPRRQLPDDDARHGTVNGYQNLKCRCERCRQAWALQFHRLSAKRERNLPLAEHGKDSTYRNWRCRCAACKAAHAAVRAADRRKRSAKAVA